MKKIAALLFSLNLLALGQIFAQLSAKDYALDPAHSQVSFKIKHLSVSNVAGTFGKFSGFLSADGDKLKALNGEVEVASINTNNDMRDNHIKDAEYFNAAKFPKATLRLVKIEGEKGLFDLTIKGITKQISLEVEIFGTSKNREGKDIIGLNLSGKLNRKDFDISKNTPNAALGEEVKISIDIEGVAK